MTVPDRPERRARKSRPSGKATPNLRVRRTRERFGAALIVLIEDKAIHEVMIRGSSMAQRFRRSTFSAWKIHLQQMADQIRIPITVRHYPPGTSKWNKIERRLFSFISLNWRGQALINYEAIVNLIGGTKTRTGLKVKGSTRMSMRPNQSVRRATREIQLRRRGSSSVELNDLTSRAH